MASPKSSRNGQIESRRRGLSSSFHGPSAMSVTPLRRPKTISDLSSLRSLAGTAPEGLPRQPTKILLKVTVLRSLAPVQVLMTPDSTVHDLIAAVVRQYVKEIRRPILPTSVPSDFDLHYSQFSLESLDRKDKVLELGCRNFFLCPRKAGGVATSFASCAKEVGRERCGRGGGGFAWFMM